jgi:hypothetical protein
VACEWDQIKIVTIICEVADRSIIESKNRDGKTAVDIAYEENTQECYPYLCHKYDIKMSWAMWCAIL